MEIITKAVLVHSLENIELFSVKVNDGNYRLIRKRLEYESGKIINILKELKEQGQIKGISKPKNWRIQKQLNQLNDARKIIKQSISNISEIFYK